MRATEIASVLMLVLGLSVGAAIYVLSPDEDENLALYEMTASKQYNRELQRFGGKALGVTIGWLSVGAALVLYFTGRRDK